ncbi:hypothetical protein SAMN03159341_13636 [Paenibacillus sp. 1_12]|uniref:hypothetical protein n=1 Tax=Paenibacillus sp. 1_12 TaxID=1566278 RepID=UPI0008DF107C|nr:hypothetical protein [Paenibacillus sp. 1_12]SFM47582.1 hypothetical protein SAMN03159341_13636 [Paenibacillus sp. 1_12]
MGAFTDILKDRFTIVPAIRDDEHVAQVVKTTKTMDITTSIDLFERQLRMRRNGRK